jgi:restriction endonuclease S subunit
VLLEGLEISEVMLSAVNQSIGSSRLDAEFFRKDYLKNDWRLSKKTTKRLTEITSKIDVGFVGSMTQHYRKEGVPLLQTKNIDEFFVSDLETVKITPEFHNKLQKSKVVFEDILIARSGSFGKASIYLKQCETNSSDIIIIKAKETVINPYFLTAFLNSQLGVSQMIRFASGGLQGHVNLTILEELEVALLNNKFQESIKQLVVTAAKKLEIAKSTYTQAETLLLDTLGLADFSPSTEKVNIKSFKDSFVATGRLDAEYYQPKYEQVMSKITTQIHARLINLVSIKKSIEPGSNAYSDDDDGLPFLRVADYNKFGITQPQKRLHTGFVTENFDMLKKLKPKKNTILFSKDGSVGEAYCLREDADFITSGAVLHLTVQDTNNILPEYLTLALNSKLVKMQSERDAGGSIILHWRVAEIENVVVPLVDMPTQTQIADFVQQSFTLKAQSEHLLNVAKRAVEIAIETDEWAAMAYINEQELQT